MKGRGVMHPSQQAAAAERGGSQASAAVSDGWLLFCLNSLACLVDIMFSRNC